MGRAALWCAVFMFLVLPDQLEAQSFTDDPLVAQVTMIRAVQITELRARIDPLRQRAGLSGFGWTDPTLTPGVTPIKAAHVQELRTAINGVATAIGQAAFTFGENIVFGGTMKATLLAELRADVLQLEGCPISLSPTSRSVPVEGSWDVLYVTTFPGCSWTATSHASWMWFDSNAEGGTGSGAFAYHWDRNFGAARTGVVTVGNATLTVSQPSGVCNPDDLIAGGSFNANAEAGQIEIAITAQNLCGWTVSTASDWLAPQTTEGGGAASVLVTVNANQGPARTGHIFVTGTPGDIYDIWVLQAAGRCPANVFPARATFFAEGGSSSILVNANGCAWTASSSASWIALATTSGTGSMLLAYSISANTTGADRTDTVTVNGSVFTITQSSTNGGSMGCQFTVSPPSLTVTSVGGSGALTVATDAGCSWTVQVSEPWFGVPNEPNRLGPGTLAYTVDPNPTASERVAKLTVGDQVVLVTQLVDTPDSTLVTGVGTSHGGKYFGYYNPFSFSGPPDRLALSSIDDQAGHVNFIMDNGSIPSNVCSSPADQNSTNAVCRAVARGLKLLVWAPLEQRPENNRNGWPPADATTQSLTEWRDKIRQLGTNVAGILLHSEAQCQPNGVLSCETLAAHLNDSSGALGSIDGLPGVPQLLIFNQDDPLLTYFRGNPAKFPATVAAIGLDCYASWEDCGSGALLRELEILFRGKAFVLMPPAFASLTGDVEPVTEKAARETAGHHKRVAVGDANANVAPDNNVVAVMPYLWTFRRADNTMINQLGVHPRAAAREEPVLRAAFIDLGLAVIGHPDRPGVRTLPADALQGTPSATKDCDPTPPHNFCVRIKWNADAYGTGIQMYRQNEDRTTSRQICAGESTNPGTSHDCVESFSVLPSDHGQYVLELMTSGKDRSSFRLWPRTSVAWTMSVP